MKINVLGSGTILSGVERVPAGFLLSRKNSYALLDCGPGVLYQLKKLNIDILRLDTILLTHFHLDHCADVFPLLMNRALLNARVNRHLRIIGPPGLKEWFTLIAQTQGSWLAQGMPVLVELADKPVSWSGFKVRYWPNGHTAHSVSYRFEKDDSAVFFSGDCGYSEELVAFARGADLAFVECSYPDEAPQQGHLTPGQVAALAQRAGFGRVVLVHIYPENDRPDLLNRVKKAYTGKVIVGQDLMDFDLNKPADRPTSRNRQT